MARILVIEDEPQIRANLRRFLQLEGHEVIEAGNGVQGVEAAGAQRPDLILCDVMLPELDGFGVLAAVRGDAAIAGTPFIFLTASAENETIKHGLGAGADDYVVKPFVLRELTGAIERCLKRT